MIVGAALIAVGLVARGVSPIRVALLLVGACLWMGMGPGLLLVAGAAVVVGSVRLARVRRRTASSDVDEADVIDLIVLGLEGGLGFPQAARFAAARSGGSAHTGIGIRLRRFLIGDHRIGEDPSLLDEAFAVAGRSEATGAAVGPALASLSEARRREGSAIERARLARLPVKLLFPLSLLILPGFVLLAVGPTVISGLARLGT